MLINFNMHNKLTDLKVLLCSGIGCDPSIKILDFFPPTRLKLRSFAYFSSHTHAHTTSSLDIIKALSQSRDNMEAALLMGVASSLLISSSICFPLS